MGHVGGEQTDQLRLARGLGGRSDAKGVRARLALRAAAGAGADDDRKAAVAEVARMGASLAAVADDRDRRAFQRFRLRVFVSVDPFQFEVSFRAKENPRSGRGAGVFGPVFSDFLEP